MDPRRLLLATALSLAILFAWQAIFPPPPPVEPPPEAVESVPIDSEGVTDRPRAIAGEPRSSLPTSSEAQAAAGDESSEAMAEEQQAATKPVASLAAEREELVVLDTERYRAELTNRGGQLLSFELKRHRENGGDGAAVDLVRRRVDWPYPFALTDLLGEPLALNEALFEIERWTEGASQALTFRYSGPLGRAEKEFRFNPDGLIEIDFRLPGETGWAVLFGPGIRNPTTAEIENRFAARQGIYRLSEDVERVDVLKADEPVIVTGSGLAWVGLQDNYFLSVLLPREPLASARFLPTVALRPSEDEPNRFRYYSDSLPENEEEAPREVALLLEGADGRLAGSTYWGGKSYEQLAALPGDLDDTLNLGFFSFLAKPMLRVLIWIYDNVVHNYGWAIVLMTVLIKILLFPLTHKSHVSMQRMQAINPKMQAIRAKYRSKLKDKQGRPNAEAQRKMNEEIMALYKTEGVNPLGGCLPMLLQLPVFFAFYRLLGAAGELRQAPFFGWVQDLAAPDPYYVLPIVMGVSWYLQQKITPMSGDPMQRKIFQFMPVVFTFFFLGLPSGLVLYWLTNNVLTAVQMLAYRRLKQEPAAAK